MERGTQKPQFNLKAYAKAVRYQAVAERFTNSRPLDIRARVRIRKSDYGRLSETSFYRRSSVAERSLIVRSYDNHTLTDNDFAELERIYDESILGRADRGETTMKELLHQIATNSYSVPTDRKGFPLT
jgi:hypothetical protein